MDIETAALQLVKAEKRFEALKSEHSELRHLNLTEMYQSVEDRAVFAGDWYDNKVIVKLLFTKQQKAKTTEIYEMQSRAFKALKTKPNRIAETLFHLPNEGLFVFEYIDGTGFDELLKNASRQEAEKLYNRAGYWLRDFTEPTRTKNRVFRKILLQRARKYPQRISEPKTLQLAQQMFLCLRKLSHSIGTSDVDRAVAHMDLYPRNLMQTDDAVYGIDLQNTNEMFVFDDIARFMMGASWMQERDHPLTYGVDEAFLSAFLSGYGADQSEDMMHSLRFFIAKAVLDHLCTRNQTLKQIPYYTQMAQQFIRVYGT